LTKGKAIMTPSSTKSPKLSSGSAAKKPTTASGAPLPSHLSNLTKCAETLYTSDGCGIDVWELRVQLTDENLSAWASHFRQHYCSDSEIDVLRDGTGLSRTEYLTQLVFPDKSARPGPGIRAGDFAEILVSDYVEHLLGYWVSREKYADKGCRDESVKGVDILGFHQFSPTVSSPKDTLLAFEVKAQLTGDKDTARLQAAIEDSSKDYLRRGMTLNATKRRLLRAKQHDRALMVSRFQNLSDHPYVYRSGAAAVLTESAYDEILLNETTVAGGHQNAKNLELIVIRGKELMKLVHALYERAANEA
jgi:hypothetical protein